eukprot:TRINITY_DN55474_c0_g1_i1.p1 TRINITY_DN55474_c0_g1~~TRINITY_DN55474_c0_g1_i1.p1  ORF type:complete len:458 (+),score=48.05 TRINITY_DN55474_c0_g1_i1:54-1427(+)
MSQSRKTTKRKRKHVELTWKEVPTIERRLEQLAPRIEHLEKVAVLAASSLLDIKREAEVMREMMHAWQLQFGPKRSSPTHVRPHTKDNTASVAPSQSTVVQPRKRHKPQTKQLPLAQKFNESKQPAKKTPTKQSSLQLANQLTEYRLSKHKQFSETKMVTPATPVTTNESEAQVPKHQTTAQPLHAHSSVASQYHQNTINELRAQSNHRNVPNPAPRPRVMTLNTLRSEEGLQPPTSDNTNALELLHHTPPFASPGRGLGPNLNGPIPKDSAVLQPTQPQQSHESADRDPVSETGCAEPPDTNKTDAVPLKPTLFLKQIHDWEVDNEEVYLSGSCTMSQSRYSCVTSFSLEKVGSSWSMQLWQGRQPTDHEQRPTGPKKTLVTFVTLQPVRVLINDGSEKGPMRFIESAPQQGHTATAQKGALIGFQFVDKVFADEFVSLLENNSKGIVVEPFGLPG